MRDNELARLRRIAEANGVQTSYIDNVGRKQFASEETLRLILDRLGAFEETAAPRMIEPVIPCWQKARNQLLVQLPARDLQNADLRLKLEDGSEERIPLKKLALFPNQKVSQDKIAILRLDLPDLPTGYHSLFVETDAGSQESLLISAAKRLFAEPVRLGGAFLPLYSAHSESSWGAGNFSDWRALCQWIGSVGGNMIGTLPIMASMLDKPVCDPSPYSPASRLFWNEFFIDITAIPEFQNSPQARKLAGSTPIKRSIEAFRRSEFIDYEAEWVIRRRVLEVLAQEFFAKHHSRFQEFKAFLKQRPEVTEYAEFRAVCDRTNRSWHSWGAEAQTEKLRSFSEETKNFYLYVQWIAQQQVDAVLRSCRTSGVKFYLDLPLGVNPDGFDAWRYRDFFAPRVNAGAPPDSFFTRGQDWGFAPLHPQRTRELKYRYVIDYLRFQMRHTGLLRIDHVMGLHRLWWVPQGHPANAGAYVRYPAEELYAILSVESHRHGTMLVGENLGTVPPEVNKSMDRHGLRRMYVLQYEHPLKGPPRTPLRSEVASVNTHDMPSFAAYWNGFDIADRFQLGLMSKKGVQREERAREKLRRNLISFLRKRKFIRNAKPALDEVLDGVLRFMGRSPAAVVLVNLEDLWGEMRSQNVPGTSSERPNWRRKARKKIEGLTADKALAERLRRILAR